MPFPPLPPYPSLSPSPPCPLQIHDRMPVILPPDAYNRWLANLEPDPHDLLVPFASELMIWPINTRVSKPENNDASILAAVDLKDGHSLL